MQKFKKQIINELYTNIIPFWKEFKDDINGGWIGYADHQGNKDIYAHKGAMLQIRVAWFFSRLYQYDPKPEYQKLAKHQFDYILEHIVDPSGGVIWETDYKGVCIDQTKHLYYQSFALYAATQYYDSFKDEKAKDLAHHLFNYIEDNFRDDKGYIEQLNSEVNRLSEGGITADRTMNSLLHLIESYTTYTHVFKLEPSRKALKSLLDLFRDKVYNIDKKRLEVLFDHDMNSLLDYHSYGHDIEASWLLDFAVDVLDDQSYRRQFNQITDILCDSIYTKGIKNKGIKTESINNIEDQNYVWWVQSEGVLAFYKKWLTTQNPSYKRIAYDLMDFIQNHQTNKELGELNWKIDLNYIPDQSLPMVSNWKCPYHNGRMCIELLEVLKTHE